ncbi:hypothetical protein C0993_003464 [Termitomyces sp. T159_Od127]|nr:hypothetical protein C0993_003464 [Termitomyces sp. T159_Od127]
MASQAVAAASKKVVPHPPPFAELFRRSKFASYDPAIRQTYQAPPANAHRGDWGVKRPISLRRKNAFISLTSFEHHAHFTEWNHAENQVRFIRRIEEMGGNAVMDHASAWNTSLGSAKTAPPFDSDFCPGEKWEPSPRPQVQPETVRFDAVQSEGVKSVQSEAVQSEGVQSEEVQSEAVQSEEVQPEVEGAQPKTVNLDTLGKRGPGAYGTQRMEPKTEEAPQEVFVSRNIQAMSKREFKRYLRSLRAQRPEFKKFVDAHEQIEEKNLYALASHANNLCYRNFLQSQMQKEFADYDGQKMEPRPHPNGALLYTSPTVLESSLWTQSKPGFYLHDLSDPMANSTQFERHIVSFGGLTARVLNDVIVGKQMLLAKNSDKGVEQENIEESVLQMKLNPLKPIMVSSLPRTVGNKPQGLKAVRVHLSLIKGDSEQMGWSNTHPHGSREYVAMDQSNQPLNNYISTPKQEQGEFLGKKDTKELLSTLQAIIPKRHGDHDL